MTTVRFVPLTQKEPYRLPGTNTSKATVTQTLCPPRRKAWK